MYQSLLSRLTFVDVKQHVYLLVIFQTPATPHTTPMVTVQFSTSNTGPGSQCVQSTSGPVKLTYS